MACVGVNEGDHRLLPCKPSKFNMQKRRGPRRRKNFCSTFHFDVFVARDFWWPAWEQNVKPSFTVVSAIEIWKCVLAWCVFNDFKGSKKNNNLKNTPLFVGWQAWGKTNKKNHVNSLQITHEKKNKSKKKTRLRYCLVIVCFRWPAWEQTQKPANIKYKKQIWLLRKPGPQTNAKKRKIRRETPPETTLQSVLVFAMTNTCHFKTVWGFMLKMRVCFCWWPAWEQMTATFVCAHERQ